MICVLIVVATLTRGGQCNADNSSSSAAAAAVGAVGAARRSGDLAATLRRQLMRDNYDYQNTHTDDDTDAHPPSQKVAGIQSAHVLRTNENDLRDQHDEPEDPDEQQDEHPRAQDSQDTSQRDHQYDVPAGVDAADTHDTHELPDSGYDTARDARQMHSPPQHHAAARPLYDPSYYNKRRDSYHRGYALDEMQVAPVSRHQRAEPGRPAASTELRRPHVTRDNRLRQYDPREHGSSRPAPHAPPARVHNVSKKDLYYYVDDDQLRRNNDVSADFSLADADNVNNTIDAYPATNASTEHANVPERPSSASRAEHHPPRSQLVTASTSNVTYRVLTIKSGAGRRSGARRVVEERAAGGGGGGGDGAVALVSLDRAPPPALRLPRARRQYMRDHSHEAAPRQHQHQHQHRRQHQ